MEAITKHCGDLQNEQPNPTTALNAVKKTARCRQHYFEPIRAAIAQPFSTRMPKDRVCKRLKQSNGEICNVKYQVQVDNNLSDEEMLAQLKKKRVKELKGILNDRGVKCEGCLEKDDFIKKIMATNACCDTPRLPRRWSAAPPVEPWARPTVRGALWETRGFHWRPIRSAADRVPRSPWVTLLASALQSAS